MTALISLPLGLSFFRKLNFPHKVGVLDRVYGRRLAKAGVGWIETAGGPLWKLDLLSASHRSLVYGDFGPSSFPTWATSWLADGGTVIDSGANIGQTVLTFAPVANTNVFAFEPNPTSATWLEECLRTQSAWSVEIVRYGLSDAATDLPFLVPEFVGEHGAQATLHTEWYKNRQNASISIRVDRLDTFVAERGIASIRLWKLDVEGWEHKALIGAEAVLKQKIVQAIYLELHPDNEIAVMGFLDSCGYSLFKIGAHGELVRYLGGSSQTRDVIAMPVSG